MVLRKPYAFLIKYFKLIHLFLAILFIFLVAKLNGVLRFYNDFIAGTANRADAGIYMTNYYMIAIVLAISICVIMYILLRYKKKPRFLYVILVGALIVNVLLLNTAHSGLYTIQFGVLDSKTMRLNRDLLRIFSIFQYIGTVMVLIRGLGFDIKKFDFVKDLEDLNITEGDNEEVEVTFNGTNKIQRKVNRNIRELRYYYFENKAFIHSILGIVIVIVVGSYISNVKFVNKIYKQGESFSSGIFNFNIQSTYVTNVDKDNKQILEDDDNTFVVIKAIVASTGEKRKLNMGNLLLRVGNNSYSSDNYFGDRLSDLGQSYHQYDIGNAHSYLFLYKIPKADAGKKMMFIYEKKKVSLDPVMLDTSEKFKNYKLGSSIDLSSSILKSGHFTIVSADIKDKFPYNYEYEVNGQKFNGSYNITSIKGGVLNLEIDSAYPNKISNYEFFKNYVVLNYKKGDKEYSVTNMDDKTPASYTKGLYLGVNKEILDADSIWLNIKIRNKQYSYTLK